MSEQTDTGPQPLTADERAWIRDTIDSYAKMIAGLPGPAAEVARTLEGTLRLVRDRYEATVVALESRCATLEADRAGAIRDCYALAKLASLADFGSIEAGIDASNRCEFYLREQRRLAASSPTTKTDG